MEELPPEQLSYGRTANWAARSFLATVTVGISLVALTLVLFASPLADDLCRAGKVRAVGMSDSFHDEYFGWAGRWSSSGISYALSDFTRISHSYPVVLLVINLSLPVVVFAVLTQLFPNWSLLRRLGSSFVFFVLFWTRSQGVDEVFYWMTGAIENQLSIVMGVILIAVIAAARPSSRSATIFFGALAVAGALTVTGMHELFAIQLCIVLAVGAIISGKSASPYRWLWYITLATAIAGFAFVYTAPGNAIRMSFFPDRGNVKKTLFWSGIQGMEFFPAWICDTALLLLTVLFLSSPQVRAAHPWWASNAWQRRLIVLGGLLAIAAGLAGPSWAMGGRMPHRTENSLYLIFLLVWFGGAFVLSRGEFADAIIAKYIAPIRSGPWPMLVSVGLAGSFLATPQLHLALKDLLLDARHYKQAMAERNALVAQARAEGKTSITVPSIVPWPRLFPAADITTDPADWHNMGAAAYYDIGSIATAPSEAVPYPYMRIVRTPIILTSAHGWPASAVPESP